MKVLYLDLSAGYEDFSLAPARYGGCRIFAAHAKQNKDFYIASTKEGFENFTDEDNSDCKIVFSKNQIEQIRNGAPLSDFIQREIDIVVHSSPEININTKIKTCSWAPGYAEKVNINCKNLLCHNFDYQKPIFLGAQSRIFDVKLGVAVPKFEYYKKDNYIFNCVNHGKHWQDLELIKFCIQFNVPLILAGPICEDFQDQFNKALEGQSIVKYVGVLTQQEKVEYLKKARAHTLLYNIPINNMPLSGFEALSYGVPLITNGMGALKNFINSTIGFNIDSERSFMNAYNTVIRLDQFSMWRYIKDNYSSEIMVSSFYSAFEKIIYE